MLLEDRLVLFPDLSFNDLASVAIDQEGTIRACVEAEEKKRKRVMLEPSRGAPLKYRLFYMPPEGRPR
jgi:hypothetical protein